MPSYRLVAVFSALALSLGAASPGFAMESPKTELLPDADVVRMPTFHVIEERFPILLSNYDPRLETKAMWMRDGNKQGPTGPDGYPGFEVTVLASFVVDEAGEVQSITPETVTLRDRTSRKGLTPAVVDQLVRIKLLSPEAKKASLDQVRQALVEIYVASAIQNLSRPKYRPATLNGKPVAVKLEAEVRYTDRGVLFFLKANDKLEKSMVRPADTERSPGSGILGNRPPPGPAGK